VGDREVALLVDCGKPLPLLEQAVFTREKGSDSVLEQVPAGLLRRFTHFVRQLRSGRKNKCWWRCDVD
jgi:hypothetical protein